jgi:DNA sulfur modification protein DndE
MSIKQIRLSAQAREQLIRLKMRTGITQWNILCRWAFCLSLQQSSPPTPIEIDTNSNVEMDWQTFGGDAQELYMALLKERCVLDGMGTSDDVLARQFRLHLHRGIGYLATPHAINSISDLARLAAPESTANPVVPVPDFAGLGDQAELTPDLQEHPHEERDSAGTRPDSDRNGRVGVPRLS